ncbi:YaaL family protein [Bacillus xiapuensis]|uniref:YaaL family protein n=1 Tax=Bacillus xiapuensis TaxID=2014075 RepID=UPI000C24CCCC|nr:YaaL family protein [Bacillus xiapuensis]
MFFRKRNKLKAECDERLIQLLEHTRQEWFQHRELLRLSFDHNEELAAQTKIREAKYFFLFREVKKRNISIKN